MKKNKLLRVFAFILLLIIILTLLFLVLKKNNNMLLKFNDESSPITFDYLSKYEIYKNLNELNLNQNSIGSIVINNKNAMELTIQVISWHGITCREYIPCENPYSQIFVDKKWKDRQDINQEFLNKNLVFENPMYNFENNKNYLIYEKDVTNNYAEIIKVKDNLYLIISINFKNNEITNEEKITNLIEVKDLIKSLKLK